MVPAAKDRVPDFTLRLNNNEHNNNDDNNTNKEN